MARGSNIGGMLAQSGLAGGQNIAQAYQQLGRGVGGMFSGVAGALERRQEKRRAQSAQEQFQQILGAYSTNPDKLMEEALLAKNSPDVNLQRMGQLLEAQANRVREEQKLAAAQRTADVTGRGKGNLMALAYDPAFDITDPKQRSGYIGMASASEVPLNEAMQIAIEAKKSKATGGSSFRQEIFDPTSGTMQQVNFLTDLEGRVVGQQVLGASAGPEKPAITVKEKDGIFYTFEDGKPVGEYESRSAADAAAQEQNKANEAILKAQRVKLSISDAIGMIERNENVGGWKQLLKFLPDTEARRFENYLTSIKANVGFDQLLQIKDAGSTLGQVSNIENLLLQSTIDSLDGLMSKEDLVQALNKIDAYYTSLITKAKFGADSPLEEWAGSVDWLQPEFARMYEQQGGEIVVNENEGTIMVKSPSGETIKLLR